MRTSLFLVCVLCALCQLSLAVVHGPRLSRRMTREPVVIEMNVHDSLKEVYEKAQEKESSHERFRRSDPPTNAPSGFGTTAILNGDHHTFALVHWSGVPKQNIFILTRDRDGHGHSRKSYLWLSTNYGKSFQNVTNLFPSTAILEWYYISPDANKLIFCDVKNKKIYTTLDEGATFTEYSVSFTPDHLQFQYSNVPNAAAYDTFVLGYDNTNQSLWISTNTGASWIRLGQNVTRYLWRQLNATYEDGSMVYFDRKINSTACLLYNASNVSYASPQLYDPSLGVFMPNSFTLSHRYMFVQKNYTDIGRNTNSYTSPLLVSHYRQAFKTASFALQLQEQHYAMVDGSEGQVLMGVFHDANNTNLYISEEAGLNYSLSLEHLISPPEYDWINKYPTFDVYVVEGIPGTYLVNRRIYGTFQGATLISFDKGGVWNPLTPPTVDSNGHPITCNLPCSLHLHMYVDQSFGFQPVLSQDSAPNIIMGLGNLGNNLNRYNYSGLRLYISDNGGVSWRELASGYKEFQLINFGVFVSIVDKWRQAYYVLSSCDEGYHWNNYTFTANGTRINVVRMFTEYGEESQHATIFGYRPGANIYNFEWLVIDLDFTTLSLNNCTSNDYYQWKPTDERESQQCILGESITYERRRPDHCCLINYDYDRPITRSPCFCAYEDFECRSGFERVGLDGSCTPMDGTVYPPSPPPVCEEASTYSYPSEYRKIAGDKCINGNQTFYLDVTVECPVTAPADLTISTTPNVVAAGDSVTFTLLQNTGARIVTTYMWHFGDGHMSQNITGLTQAGPQQHTYINPGVYTVTAFAHNNGGSNMAQINITVQDTVTGINVQPKLSHVGERMNYLIQNVTTQYGTQYYEPATYTWEFPDGQPPPSHTKVMAHTFLTAGTKPVRVIVSNSARPFVYNFNVTVQNYPSGLTLTATVNGQVHAIDTTGVVPVNESVTFTVHPGQSGTTYDWDISENGNNIFSVVTTGSSIAHTFNETGTFVIGVTSHNLLGVSKISKVITSEYVLSLATITIPHPVYRVNSEVTATLDIELAHVSAPRKGNLYVHVNAWADISADAPFGSGVVAVKQGSTDFTFRATVAGNVTVHMQVYNNVSAVDTTTLTLMVAGPSSYGYLRLLFPTSSLTFNYTNNQQQLIVRSSVIQKLQSKYHIESWRLNVTITVENVHHSFNNIVQRQTADSLYLVAHVYILPVSLNTAHIQTALNITQNIVNDANNGTIAITINRTTILRPESADFGPAIVDVIHHNGGKNYKPLAISLGVGIFVFIIIAILVIVTIFYYWKKKYRSLQVRYTRLRQGPMRFTFSAEGETLDEDDWQDDDQHEKEEEEIDSDKIKPLGNIDDMVPLN